MSITDVDFRLVWQWLSVSNRLFFLYFCGVSVYTLYLSAYVFFRLHSLNKNPARENAFSSRSPLGKLNRRLANLRQLHLFTLYLFGFFISLSIPRAFTTFGDSKTVPFGQFIQGLTSLFYFGTPIFFALVLLHSLQWLTSARLSSYAGRHD